MQFVPGIRDVNHQENHLSMADHLTHVSQSSHLLPSSTPWHLPIIITFQIVSTITCTTLVVTILRTPEKTINKLILNQCLVDLLAVDCVFVPICIAYYVKPTNLIHQLLPFVTCYIILVSLFSLSLLAAYRYWNMRNPIKAFAQTRHHKAKIIHHMNKLIIATWIIPLFVTLVPLTWMSNTRIDRILATKIFVSVIWVLLLIIFISMLVIYSLIIKRYKMSREKSIFPAKKNQSLSMTEISTFKPRCSSAINGSADNLDVDTNSPRKYSRHLIIKKSSSNYELESPVSTTNLNCRSPFSERKRQDNRKRELRMTALLGAMLLNFFISYFPILFINFFFLFKEISVPPWLELASFYTFDLNSTVTPILCIFMLSDVYNLLTRQCKRMFRSHRMTNIEFTIKYANGGTSNIV